MSSAVEIALPNGLKYEQPTGLFIDNKFVPGSGAKFAVFNPTNDEEIITLQGASEEDVDTAVHAARKAFEGEWSELAALQRGNLLLKLSELIDRDRKLIASIDALDNGKTYSTALSQDIDASSNVFKYYAGAADKITGQTIETSPAKLAYVLKEPLGVCGQIIPWNYPFMMLAWKVAPALACGNTVILKPAEQTPLSALYFGNLVIEAGFPPGVVNILPGLGSVTGKALAEHLDVDKIAFTGSTATGRAIMKSAATNLKNITLECGGKNPSIVFEDADLEQAVRWCHVGIMGNQGQVCISTSRIYVHEAVYEKFLQRFVEVTKEHHKLGDPFHEDTWQGPQVSKQQYEKVLSYIEDGKKCGARLLHGGAKHGEKGYFIEPTVFADTTEDMKIVQEEIFGPVVVVSKFGTTQEVLTKANASEFGLAAAVFTENIKLAHRVARKLQSGMVFVNSSGDAHFGVPFGGYKMSDIGRELGQYAMDAYTQSKAVHVNLVYQGSRKPNQLAMYAYEPNPGQDASGEKIERGMERVLTPDGNSKTEVVEDSGEVFKHVLGQTEFRTLGWIRTGIILMKLCFATGVLAIPSAFSVVGYAPGIIVLLCWGSMTTYYAYIMYLFRMKYRGVHNIADAAAIMGGPVAREVASGIFLLTWVLASGSGFIGLSQGFKVLANGKVCTVVWTLVAAICTGLCSSIPTLGKLAILTWIGFASIFTAVFVVVVGVTTVDRPAAAPQTGLFNLEVVAVGAPGFVAGLTAVINLFAGYGSTPTFMPVIAEMRNPKSYLKALFSSQGALSACYISFGMVVYFYCGQYVASPSLASAGGTIEKIAYGISIPGFIMTSTLWVHLAAKFLLVRILRDSDHLQSNSAIHWVTWLGSTLGITTLAFIVAEAVPFFSYLLGLIGSLCCAPTCLIIPAFMGLYMDRGNHRSSKVKMAICGLHFFTIILGAFITVAGTYTTISSIIDAYHSGAVGGAFTCS
ncbi:hypothetical protein G7046_g380 [Stylonectria norvegica]|nr:hypothetical protein G7046_g380 [Stylonectria norvegica]